MDQRFTTFSHFIFLIWGLSPSPFYRGGEERLNNLFRITQLVRSRASIELRPSDPRLLVLYYKIPAQGDGRGYGREI